MPSVPVLIAIARVGALPDLEPLLARIEGLGADAIQIRDRRATDREVFEFSRDLRRQAPERLSIIVNRRPDIALAAGAQGVHLPANGLPLARVRASFGDEFLIGRSTHSFDEVEQARDGGADYVFFGPIYETPAKVRFGPPQGLDKLAEVAQLGVPTVAIGGITRARIPEVLERGAHGAAAIRMFQADVPRGSSGAGR